MGELVIFRPRDEGIGGCHVGGIGGEGAIARRVAHDERVVGVKPGTARCGALS